MIHIIILIGGVCCALLCHWMVRHTFSYRLEDTGGLDWMRRPDKRKVWDKKVTLPRWYYILLWGFCILLAPVAIVAPIVAGFAIGISQSDGAVRFVYTNRFIEWLKKEV